jgi:predicted TIM-barrel fold metal-dependent hydrolase
VRVIDAFVNPVFWGPDDAPDYVAPTLSGTFQTSLGADRPGTPDGLVAEMDEIGVDHAILSAVDGYWPQVLEFVEAHPDRFSFSVEVDPRRGMETVRQVERAVRDHGAILVRMVPFVVGLPPSDRVYYPVFAKCVELGVPAAVNTGIPAPQMPAAPQQPLHLDEVLRFFPELKLVMQHGADPWWGEAIRLLLKYPNLFMMTSAWAPKYLPDELVHFMNTRGRGKVMWATDWPALPFDRCLREAREMPLRPGVLEEYLAGAAERLWPLLAPDGAHVEA